MKTTTEKTNDLHDAIERAEMLRSDHNGIFGVEIFLGHDGNNICRLLNNDGVQIGMGRTGTSLLDAVKIAEQECRYQRLRDASNTSAARAVEDAITKAIELFGGQESGVFNTASFDHALNNQEPRLTSEQLGSILRSNRRIVQLEGGAHWIRLPETFRRLEEEVAPIMATGSTAGGYTASQRSLAQAAASGRRLYQQD